MNAANQALRTLVCCTLIGLSIGVEAATVDLTRYLLRLDVDVAGARQDTFAATPGHAALSFEGTVGGMTVTLNGEWVHAGAVKWQANNVIAFRGEAATPLRVRITQRVEGTLDVLSRIHFNTNVSDCEAARAFYGVLGFKTLSGFSDANTVAMARAIGIAEPTRYDGSKGGEPGGYLLHAELIDLGFNRDVIDLIDFTIPRNDEPPYPALNRLGIARAVFETADIDSDYETLAAKGGAVFVATRGARRWHALRDSQGSRRHHPGAGGNAVHDLASALHEPVQLSAALARR